MRRPAWVLRTIVVVAALAAAVTVEAQFRQGRGGGGGRTSARLAIANDFTGQFMFCRIVFRNAVDGDGGGWGVDYPRADENLSIRLSELTKTTISREGDGFPRHVLVRFNDPQIFSCPFVMMTEPGGAFLDPAEAEGLRNYVDKGGFLWADDFWGEYAWAHWVAQLRKALPAPDFPVFDLAEDHPLFKAQFDVPGVPQIPAIGLGFGRTSERGAETAVPHARGIADSQGRLIVLMTHNTDIGDSWEREGDDPQYFLAFGPKGYAFGINAVLYALTH
ncbi:MAG: DUF4159 domain-containing protein [Vicinamibacterales bacterium]